MLDRLGMIGVSWRQGHAETLADFALDSDRAAERLRQFAAEAELGELAYLATCNRVELIFRSDSAAPRHDLRPEVFALLTGRTPEPGEAERTLRAWQGEGAAEHLFLIAAGLDSACVGETEVVGQVKAGYAQAEALGLIGPTLKLVFDEALRIAARVRHETALGRGRLSLAAIAVEAIRERLGRTQGPVALLGVSPMTERAGRSLATAGVPVVVVNRSVERARELATRLRGRHMGLDAFLDDPPAVEAVLAATGAADTIIREPALERLAARTASGEPPLIVDMAVPADVGAEACRKLGVKRIGMDEIVDRAERNRAFRLSEAAEARDQIDAALEQLKERIAERYYGPLLGALQRRYRRTAEEGVRRLLKKELKGLGPEERAAIETWTEVLARRFAHIPSLGLRGLINDGPEGSVEAFLGGLEPEFADELRAALAGGEPPAATASVESRTRRA